MGIDKNFIDADDIIQSVYQFISLLIPLLKSDQF